MGASFGYASVDSLDMSWLPLSRFESRAVCVAVCVHQLRFVTAWLLGSVQQLIVTPVQGPWLVQGLGLVELGCRL
jgi:hypothetical protein